MQCMFLRRGVPNPVYDIRSLFKRATGLIVTGRGSSNAAAIYMNHTRAPENGVCYAYGALYSYGERYCLHKITDRVVGDAFLYYPSGSTTKANIIKVSDDRFVLTTGNTASNQYAGTMCLFQFNVPTEISDSILSSCTPTVLAAPNGTGSNQTLRTTDTTHNVVLVCKCDTSVSPSIYDFEVWYYKNGWQYINAASVESPIASASGTTLSIVAGPYGSGLILALD